MSIDASIDRCLSGESDAMRRVRRELARLAPLDTTVLLTGPTGTGKGVAARALHRASGRRGAFVHADCASLPPSLFESELFGHERGAFTGAHARRAGRLERADGGTLFLDEIGELDAALQTRLLRVLQDRRFERLGGVAALPMRGRVVAATSRDLAFEVRAGRFRADLYFRVAVAVVALPPLAERAADVETLAHRLTVRVADRLGLERPVLGPAALDRLARHPWPGNVRELENAIERLVIRFAGRAVGEAEAGAVLDAAPAFAGSGEQATPGELARALDACGGNVAAAARSLGLPRTTLRRRLDRVRDR
ncbi:MAG: sigma 54-interacting transcriptional regulator [Myxococcota bacterium]